MKLDFKSIDKDLRLEGVILRMFSPLGFESVQRAVSPVSDKFLSLFKLKKLNCEKCFIKRADGSDMRLCIMRSNVTNGKSIGILWLHGGGYSLGAPEMAAMTLPRFLLKKFNCTIISPSYTLSAKLPYPAAFDDAKATLDWLLENKDRLKIDYDKIVIGGESAGGGLAAAITLYARDKGLDCFAFQIPLYPMLDDRITETSADNHAPVWSTAENKTAWKIYLGDRLMNNYVPTYASPARETDLSGLPPIITAVGDKDPFYGEDMRYFNAVSQNGIQTEIFIAKGAYHAFDMMAPYAKISKKATEFLLDKFAEYAKKYL